MPQTNIGGALACYTQRIEILEKVNGVPFLARLFRCVVLCSWICINCTLTIQ